MRQSVAKIIKIEKEIVLIGADDGSIQEVRRSDCNFDVSSGDEVEVFSSETKTVVVKKETHQPLNQEDAQKSVNIQISNNYNIPANPIYVTSSKAVNKVLYYILAFFLGSIGIHKFYAGKIGTGVLFLLFCWTGIPCIISIFDFIVGLCKSSDVNGRILV